jgi:histidine triad (HIT) family protein
LAGDCIFCRIVKGEIPAKTVYEDEDFIAFHDIDPRAPTHVLVIPRRHIPSAGALEAGDAGLAGRLVLAGARVAEETGVARGGYRLVLNTGEDGGQSVDHIHMHVLGGRRMTWPPG